MFANFILFATFCSMGTLVRRKKRWRYSARKVVEFGQLMIDILVYVSCKFELYIFKVAQVISENVRIAFLFVLSIFVFNLYKESLSHSQPLSALSMPLNPLRAKKTFIRKKLGNTAVLAIKTSPVTL